MSQIKSVNHEGHEGREGKTDFLSKEMRHAIDGEISESTIRNALLPEIAHVPGWRVVCVTGYVLANPSPLVERVIGCAIEVHRHIGPGLLESSYGVCLAHEFEATGIRFRRNVPVPVTYKGCRISCGYRADFVVEDGLLLELKSVDALHQIHQAQVLTYLKLLRLRQGLLINFNARKLVDGLRSVLLTNV